MLFLSTLLHLTVNCRGTTHSKVAFDEDDAKYEDYERFVVLCPLGQDGFATIEFGFEREVFAKLHWKKDGINKTNARARNFDV